MQLFIGIFLVAAAFSTASNSLPYITSSKNNKLCAKNNKLTKLTQIKGGSSDSGIDLKNIDWRYFVAGGICAAASHGITTPIDVVKTKMQTNPEKYNKGMLAAAKDIIKTEGIAFLLTGLAPTVVGYGLEGALKFGFYETFKMLFANLTPHKFTNFLLASVVAGAVASIVLVSIPSLPYPYYCTVLL